MRNVHIPHKFSLLTLSGGFPQACKTFRIVPALLHPVSTAREVFTSTCCNIDCLLYHQMISTPHASQT